jgi:DNA-binding LacI/PurR family transcriptional regulator
MVTIYEVAKEANVSPKTAARILSGKEGRPYNRDKVVAAATKLGYVRNQQAANLRSGKSGLLGMIVPDISNPFYPVFFQTIHDIAMDRNYQILLSSTFGRIKEEIHALRMFEMNRVEGIILNASEGESDHECDTVISRFTDRNIPVILAGRPARNLHVDEIVLRNREAVERIVAYLAKIGHQRIGFLAGSKRNLATKERQAGFEAGIKSAGLPLERHWISHGEYTAESGRKQARGMLEAPGLHPTALVAANDLIAIGAMHACKELGLSIPANIAITGFDDIQIARLVNPALTTLRQPQDRIAREAVELLIERINNKDLSQPRRLSYDPELIVRDST